MQGTILSVNIVPAGDALDGDHLAADTTLLLTSVDDFPPTGSVEINDLTYDYVSVDPVTLIMTLSTGLVTNVLAGQRVNISPPVREKWATVELQADDDAILALVPHALWDRIDEGVRDPEFQELVVIQKQEGDWLITDVLGSTPTMTTDFFEPGAIPSLSELAAQVAANTEDITTNAGKTENASETAYAANSLASTAEGRISMSDYEPSSTDISYVAVDVNGVPILDANGNQIVLTRNQGSVWFTRTRTRKNMLTNPSFEVNVSHWVASQATMLREVSLSISGSYSMKLTNSGVSGLHSVEWDMGGAPRLAAAAGQSFTASVFAAAITAAVNGVFPQICWWTAAGAANGTANGATLNLLVDDYQRLSVTALAPANTAFLSFKVLTPAGTEGATWRIDGGLIESSTVLGRYFDGRSYDGQWDGTADLSFSTLVGGKVSRVFELDKAAWIEKFFSGTTLREIDAATITVGYLDGERIIDYSIPMDKMSGTPVIASETLVAGNLVNIHLVGGAFRMRKASASLQYPADGYVLAAVSSGLIGVYYSHGYNPFVSALGPGRAWLSTTAGAASSSPSTAVGTILQTVGTAGAATVLNFTRGEPLYRT